MKLDELVSEAVIKQWRSRTLDTGAVMKLLNSRCKNGLKAIADGGLLFRGDVGTEKVTLKDSATGIRTSKDFNNSYVFMMETSEALKDYPRRSKSFICSSDFDSASDYGGLHAVIPYDGTKVAVSMEGDFIFTILGAPFCPTTVGSLSRSFGMFLPDAGKQDASASKLNAEIRAMDKEKFIKRWDRHVYPILHRKAAREQLEQLLDDSSPFNALCDTIMTPENLRLNLVDFGEQLPGRGECWFSGKALFLNEYAISELLMTLSKQGHPVHSRYKRLK